MDSDVYVYKLPPSYSEIGKNYNIIREFFAPIFQQGFIKPGDKVVLKPNFVKESHLYRLNDWEYIITHSEIIKFVLKNVIAALDNKGEIFIVDAPQTDSDFDAIIKRVNLPGIIAELQPTTNVPINYYDLREERWFFKHGVIVSKQKLQGDPKGYVSIDLASKSEFANKKNKDYYGADYDAEQTKRYHNNKNNIYVISKTILDCDVFINLPKMKTHKLAGITGSLKNIVGTCVIKNSIPHHTVGAPDVNGDEFTCMSNRNSAENALKSRAMKILKYKNPVINYPFIAIKWLAGFVFGGSKSHTIRNGSWYGNDTIWRATLDLNKIILYADAGGNMHNDVQRQYITFVDGIIGGEKEGPMAPEPKYSGVLIAATNPVCADAVMSKLMGFDYTRIPTVINASKVRDYPLLLGMSGQDYDLSDLISVTSNVSKWNKTLSEINAEDCLNFVPHPGWAGHI